MQAYRPPGMRNRPPYDSIGFRGRPHQRTIRMVSSPVNRVSVHSLKHRFSVHEETARRWAREGMIPVAKLGNGADSASDAKIWTVFWKRGATTSIDRRGFVCELVNLPVPKTA